MEEIEKTSSADRFISAMAEKLGAVAKAATVFGEPVERDGVTVIPVAKARWGFGGGGGVQVTPVGFIEIRNDQAKFRPIRTVSPAWIIAGSILSLLLLRSTLKRQ